MSWNVSAFGRVGPALAAHVNQEFDKIKGYHMHTKEAHLAEQAREAVLKVLDSTTPGTVVKVVSGGSMSSHQDNGKTVETHNFNVSVSPQWEPFIDDHGTASQPTT